MDNNFEELNGLLNKEIKVSRKQASSFLNDADVRYYFLQEYLYFNDDDNIKLYRSFINKNINDNSFYNVSEAIDLAVVINYFNDYYEIKSKLLNKNNYLVKLSCLDYLNNFYNEEIIQKEYINLNSTIKNKSSNKIVKFQVYINLLLSKFDFYSNIILRFLQKNKEPFYIYRLTSCLFDNKQFDSIFKKGDFILKIINIINENESINNEDKNDLIKELMAKKS